MKKTVRSVLVLVVICAVVSALLAVTNFLTAPIIEKNEQIKASAALYEVMPDADTFTQMELDGYKLPETVTEVYKEDGGKGYVVKLVTKGFGTDMVILCGVTSDGTVTGAKCLASNETLGAEKTYGDGFVGKDDADVAAVDTVSGATMTTAAYKNAIKDAINTASILKGEVVDLRSEEEKAVAQMTTDLGATEEVDLSQYKLPASVTKVLKGNGGYVVYMTVKGYKPGMEIVCGVSTDGTIVKAICLKSNETMAQEKTYGNSFAGKDAAGVDAVDTVSGATMTTTAYKNAVKDALNAAIILDGGEADLRTPEEIFRDNLKAALPGAEEFVKQAIADQNAAIDFIYAAKNGAGYVYVIQDKTFVGVDANGNVVTEGVSDADAALAKDKAELAAAHTAVDTTDSGINQNITSVQKTPDGNYIIEINGLGFGYFGDEAHYQPAKNIPIKICVVMTPDGTILECLTVSHQESNGYGAAWGTEEYYGQFDGTTADTYKDVDVVAGATISNNGYMKAIERCFAAVAILEGGAG